MILNPNKAERNETFLFSSHFFGFENGHAKPQKQQTKGRPCNKNLKYEKQSSENCSSFSPRCETCPKNWHRRSVSNTESK